MSDRLDDAHGRATDAVGHLTGDLKLTRAGEIDRAAAHVKEVAGRVIERAGDALKKAT